MAIIFFLVLLGVMSFGPIDLAHSAWRCNNRKIKDGKVRHRKMPAKIKVLSYLPLGCVCVTRYSFYKNYSWTSIVSILSIICIVPRLVLTTIPPLVILAASDVTVAHIQIYSLPLMYFGILLFHLLHVITYVNIMRLFRFGIFSYLFTILVPYGMALYLASQIPMQMNEQHKTQNNRFSENYKSEQTTKRKRVKSK